MLEKIKKYPVYVWIASLFGLGFIPSGMPGTVSSFAACLISVFVDVPLWAIVLVIFLGVWAAGKSEKFFEMKDPSFLNIYLLPKGFIIPGFFLFRLIDILKPWPVSAMEKLPGGWGIMADDVLGGIIGNIILKKKGIYIITSICWVTP